jgi:hypothetical protein
MTPHAKVVVRTAARVPGNGRARVWSCSDVDHSMNARLTTVLPLEAGHECDDLTRTSDRSSYPGSYCTAIVSPMPGPSIYRSKRGGKLCAVNNLGATAWI